MQGWLRTPIYHSLAAQLESNTTFFTIPGHKERASTPTQANNPIQTSAADVWVIKTWKKSHWPGTHAQYREKNHRHKETPPKTCIGTFARTHTRRAHTPRRTRKSRLCAWVQRVRTRAKLSLVRMCWCLTVARVQNFVYFQFCGISLQHRTEKSVLK